MSEFQQTYEEITLEKLGQGAIAELFDHGKALVIENIADPNTEPEKMRELTIKIQFKPDKTRQSVSCKIHQAIKLAPVKPFETPLILDLSQGKRKGRLMENQFTQGELPIGENVTPITKQTNGGN